MVNAEVCEYSVACEQACATAVENGLSVVDAKPSELFVDLDKTANVLIFMSRVESLVRNGIATDWRITRSKSGNSHGYVNLLRDTPLIERVALQCMLGSDLTHEYLTYMTYLKLGEQTRVVFFEKEQDAKTDNN